MTGKHMIQSNLFQFTDDIFPPVPVHKGIAAGGLDPGVVRQRSPCYHTDSFNRIGAEIRKFAGLTNRCGHTVNEGRTLHGFRQLPGKTKAHGPQVLQPQPSPKNRVVAYVRMGICWTTGVTGMAGVIREITGLIEFIPGLLVLFLEADLDPIFAPVERGNALFEVDTAAIRLKMGVDYTTIPF